MRKELARSLSTRALLALVGRKRETKKLAGLLLMLAILSAAMPCFAQVYICESNHVLYEIVLTEDGTPDFVPIASCVPPWE